MRTFSSSFVSSFKQNIRTHLFYFCLRLDQISGGVGSLKNQAVNVSNQAKEESRRSEDLLKSIAKINLPTSLRVTTLLHTSPPAPAP